MNTSQSQAVEVRLPKINIPSFDGDYMEWQSFFDIYSSTIHDRDNLTGAQKLQYLRGPLKGEAAALIRHLSVTDANYSEAFQKLVKRYDRKRHTINAFIKSYMDQPIITQPNASNIKNLADALDESIRGLKALGANAEKRDPWLVHIALNKLDNESRALWAQETTGKDFPTIEELFTFLGKRIDMMESIKGYSKKAGTSRLATRAYPVETSSGNPCPICMQVGHRLYECGNYKNMTSPDKSEAVKRSNRCFNCLNGGHRVKECKSKSRCQQCHRKHHTSLHGSSDGAKVFYDDQQLNTRVHKSNLPSNQEATEEVEAETKTYTASPVTSHGILPTAMIKIKDCNGLWQTYRALLDSASQATFISETCMQGLNLKRKNARILVKGLGEAGIGKTRGSTELTITSLDHTATLKTHALIVPRVSAVSTETHLSNVDFKVLNQLQLADLNFNKRGQIDVLLGVDIFFKCLESKSLKLASGLTATRTIFGWIVAGRIIETNSGMYDISNFNVLIDIDRSLRKFWEVEELPKTNLKTTEEHQCEELFQATTKTTTDNKFLVKLPFKQPGSMLGTSYNTALNRLKSMERRFQRDPEFGNLYSSFMAEYQALGHMEAVPSANKVNKYYLPHHGVLKASSTTTKLRVVFDASTKSSTGLALNDVLMVGPTVQNPLLNILLRFRQHKVVICGDVEKMYRQVWVNAEDRQYQNILWRTSPHHQPTIYQLKTLTYGTASAAFLATRCVKEIGTRLRSSHPESARAILNDMYVDDIMTGANTTAQVKTLIEHATSALASHGFQLRKFLSNRDEIRSYVHNNQEKKIKQIGEQVETPKVLGLQWDPNEDAFKFTVQLPMRDKHTKRTLLSDASRTFDPLGWLTPIIIKVKILFQNLWMQNINWDEELPPNILKSWLQIRKKLCETTKLRVPRWIQTSNKVRLIGFSDASEKAYAAVVYAVADTNEGVISNIVISKSRVAPVKQISLPRLELMGAVLLANLMRLVEDSLTVNITKIELFTDSQIVLDWLSDHPRRWTTFVANRASEIIQLYKREHWWHVASKDNPADIASRGMSTEELYNCKLWWSGPHWLIDDEETKSIQSKNLHPRKITSEELRSSKIEVFTISTNHFIENFISRYSGFAKASRVLSLIMRFINKLRNKEMARTKREEIIEC